MSLNWKRNSKHDDSGPWLPLRNPGITTCRKHIFPFLLQLVSWMALSLPSPRQAPQAHRLNEVSLKKCRDRVILKIYKEVFLTYRIQGRQQWPCPLWPNAFNKCSVSISSALRPQAPIFHRIKNQGQQSSSVQKVTILHDSCRKAQT